MSTWVAEFSRVAVRRLREATTTDLRSLAILRIVFGLFTMVYAWPAYSWLAAAPPAFFDPPALSLVSLMSGFPAPIWFQTLDAVIVTATVALTIGVFTRWATALLMLAMLVGNHFAFSFGKIDHGQVLLLCLLAVMLRWDWGAYLSLDSIRRGGKPASVPDGRADLSILAVLVAFGFFTAGYGKAVNWLDFNPDTSGLLNWLVPGYVTQGRDQLLASVALAARPGWVLEAADIAAVVFELGFAVAMFNRSTWLGWLMIGCAFHLGNVLLLNISFAANVVVYMAFAPLSTLVPRQGVFEAPRALVAVLTAVAVTCAAIRQAGWTTNGVLFAFVPGDSGLVAAAAFCTFGLVAIGMTWRRSAQAGDGRTHAARQVPAVI